MAHSSSIHGCCQVLVKSNLHVFAVAESATLTSLPCYISGPPSLRVDREFLLPHLSTSICHHPLPRLRASLRPCVCRHNLSGLGCRIPSTHWTKLKRHRLQARGHMMSPWSHHPTMRAQLFCASMGRAINSIRTYVHIPVHNVSLTDRVLLAEFEHHTAFLDAQKGR
jgi:hypothetical protein